MERRIVPYARRLGRERLAEGQRERSSGAAREIRDRLAASILPARRLKHCAPALLHAHSDRIARRNSSTSRPTATKNAEPPPRPRRVCAVRHRGRRDDAAQAARLVRLAPVAAAGGAAGGARGAAVDRRPDAAAVRAVARREEGGAAARPPRRDRDARGRRAARARAGGVHAAARGARRGAGAGAPGGGGAARRGARRARARRGLAADRARRAGGAVPRAGARGADRGRGGGGGGGARRRRTAVAALLPCYGALSLAARGALVCDLPPAPRAFAILAAVFAPAVGGGVALGPGVAAAVWRCVARVAAEEWPGKEALEALHPQIGKLPPHEQRKLGEAIPAAAPLLESAPHMQLEPWIAMAETMNWRPPRVLVAARALDARASRRRARSSTGLRTTRGPRGARLLLRLVPLPDLVLRRLLGDSVRPPLGIDVRHLHPPPRRPHVHPRDQVDHRARPPRPAARAQPRLPPRRLAAAAYCHVTGFLAFDTHERAQLLGGGIMPPSARSSLPGGLTAPKLKRLRARRDWAELRASTLPPSTAPSRRRGSRRKRWADCARRSASSSTASSCRPSSSRWTATARAS